MGIKLHEAMKCRYFY